METILSAMIFCNSLVCQFTKDSNFTDITRPETGRYQLRTKNNIGACTANGKDSRVLTKVNWSKNIVHVEICSKWRVKKGVYKCHEWADGPFNLICTKKLKPGK